MLVLRHVDRNLVQARIAAVRSRELKDVPAPDECKQLGQFALQVASPYVQDKSSVAEAQKIESVFSPIMRGDFLCTALGT